METVLLARIKGFPYWFMNVTLTLDDKLVKEIRKVAVELDKTLTGLVRDTWNSSRLKVQRQAGGGGSEKP